MTAPTLDAVRAHEQHGARWRCTPPLVTTPAGPRQPHPFYVRLTVCRTRGGAEFVQWENGASLQDVIDDGDNHKLRLREAAWEQV